MSQIPPENPRLHRTVLEVLGERAGKVSKLLLPDVGSEHGASPIVAPGSVASKLVPQGRNKYQILGEIARGGMGVILKGHDGDLGRDVALKVLDPELAKIPAVVARFVEEAQIGGQMQHPGIVPVYELGLMADDAPYFTMKLVKGRTLSALLSQRKSTTDNRTRLLSIFESVCQTIAYAHSKGVLHRDLKPANIMVGAFGEVQVVDWGLAKVLQRGGVADERRARNSLFTVIETVRSAPGSSGSDSMVGSVMGTPEYMSPEQAQGEIEKLDEHADVFSLGAILCELLTGRPPYEGTATEPALMQAARARLDPARTRVEACDADSALKSLCLDCLLPARDARPRDAEAVARAVHDYLSSVEERAHTAELAATTAHIKAAEERRARRLTLALAGTVLLALLLGGGGFYWVGQQREQRTAMVRTAVEAAFGESLQLGQQGRPADALESARHALELTRTGDADTALCQRAARFVAQAELAVSAAERERALLEQDERLHRRLVDLRLEQVPALGDRERETELHAAFLLAFKDYGVDLDGDQITAALERMRQRHIAEATALALDDLCRLRRTLFGEQSEQFQKVAFLAMDLDPDPERLRLRQAILGNDLPTLLVLGAPENLPRLGPGSIWILCATLWDRSREHQPDVFRILDHAVYRYPNDYVLQSAAAYLYSFKGDTDAMLTCRATAFSLQPDNVQARWGLANALYFAGQLIDALRVYQACVAMSPQHAVSHDGLGWTLLQLGDYQGARASFQKAVESADDPQWRADLLMARYVVGEATRQELEGALATTASPPHVLSYCCALVEYADPTRWDPGLVVRTLTEIAPALGPLRTTAGALLVALGKVRLGDWQGAHEALARHDPKSDVTLLTPLSLRFLRALIHARLGQQDAARECYARGMEGWAQLVGNDAASWERSDVMRWRRAAEQALGI